MKRIQTLHFIISFVVIAILISLSACKKSEEEDNGPFKGMSARQLRTEADKALAREQYSSATKRLEALESMYPFSDYAQKSQLDLIYAYYKDEAYPSAAATAERFTRLYPRAVDVDYAYYMKALANFQQVRGPLANFLPMDESWRDTGTQAQSYADFSVLVQRFPDSKYKADSLQRMIYLRNLFAQRELDNADYYFKRKMYVAAAARANFIIKTYPEASAAEPALAMLYRANKLMGLEQAAAEALTVYRMTYHRELV